MIFRFQLSLLVSIVKITHVNCLNKEQCGQIAVYLCCWHLWSQPKVSFLVETVSWSLFWHIWCSPLSAREVHYNQLSILSCWDLEKKFDIVHRSLHREFITRHLVLLSIVFSLAGTKNNSSLCPRNCFITICYPENRLYIILHIACLEASCMWLV